MALSDLARPYAVATFELASASGRRAEWSDMLELLAAVVSDERMAAALRVPRRSAEERAGLVLSIVDDYIDDGARNLVRLMAANGRLTQLPGVAERYEALRADAERRVDAHVTAASELDDEQRARLAQALRQRLDRDVQLYCDVDESLIGGVVIRAGDRVIDGSIRGRLQRLASALAH